MPSAPADTPTLFDADPYADPLTQLPRPGEASHYHLAADSVIGGPILHPRPFPCRWCGRRNRLVWATVGQGWLCDGCGLGQGTLERPATPEEIMAGIGTTGVVWEPEGGWPPGLGPGPS